MGAWTTKYKFFVCGGCSTRVRTMQWIKFVRKRKPENLAAIKVQHTLVRMVSALFSWIFIAWLHFIFVSLSLSSVYFFGNSESNTLYIQQHANLHETTRLFTSIEEWKISPDKKNERNVLNKKCCVVNSVTDHLHTHSVYECQLLFEEKMRAALPFTPQPMLLK